MSAHAEAAGHGHEHHHGPPAANKSSKVDPTVLGMFLFIGSEAMLFGSFFAAYFFVRVVNPDAPAVWPPPPFEFPKFVAGINTAILVTSSFTMHWALQSIKRNNRRGLQAGLVLTILMGDGLPHHPVHRVRARRLQHERRCLRIRLLRADGPPRRARLRRAHPAHDRRRAGVPWPLLAGAPSRGRAAGHLLALRRRDVDRRVRGRLPDLGPGAEPARERGSSVPIRSRHHRLLRGDRRRRVDRDLARRDRLRRHERGRLRRAAADDGLRGAARLDGAGRSRGHAPDPRCDRLRGRRPAPARGDPAPRRPG